MNLAFWVLIGGVAGLLAGLFFGDYCAVLSPIGFAYVKLLEAAVYPYLICSLLHGLGSLDPAKAWRLFKRGWAFYLKLRKADGFQVREFDDWILGQPRALSTPRWSILRDALHWVK